MAIGAASGFTNGFLSGLGNGIVQGNSFKDAANSGLNMGMGQGIGGAVLGGISGGIRAAGYDGNIWTGKPPDSPGIARASILVPESRGEVNVGGLNSELHDLNTKIIEIERFHENSTGTISEIKFGDEPVLYALEPAGPSSTIANTDRRIMEGIYEIKNYSSSGFKNVYELQNVPGRTKVLFPLLGVVSD